MGQCFKNAGIVTFYICLLFGNSLAGETTSDYLRSTKTTSKSQPGTVASGRTTEDYLRGTKATSKPLLIKAFEDVVFSGKKNDWKGVKTAVYSVWGKVTELDEANNTDIANQLERVVIAKDVSQVINLMSNAIYLAMTEELRLTRADNFKHQDMSMEHIGEARQYYEKILSVNITRKDPTLNRSIQSSFDAAVKNIEDADETGYDKAVQSIESNILKVYVKFQQKKSGTRAVGMELTRVGQK